MKAKIVFFLLWALSMSGYGQNYIGFASVEKAPKAYPNTPEERKQYVLDVFDTIPLIICNEEELTFEEFSQLDVTQYGTRLFFKIPRITEPLAGERGKNGLIYIHDKSNYFPWPNPFPDGYFMAGNYPAEFPGGEDSLFCFFKNHQMISENVLKSELDGSVTVICYFDEEGNLDKYEISRINLEYPSHLVLYVNGQEEFDSEMIKKSTRKVLNEIVDSAKGVLELLPPFKPARFYLRNVKYRMDIDVPIR